MSQTLSSTADTPSHPPPLSLHYLHAIHSATDAKVEYLCSLHHEVSAELVFRTGSESQLVPNPNPGLCNLNTGELWQILHEVIERMAWLLSGLRNELRCANYWLWDRKIIHIPVL